MRHTFIKNFIKKYPVRLMYKVLDVHPAGFMVSNCPSAEGIMRRGDEADF